MESEYDGARRQSGGEYDFGGRSGYWAFVY
jgi:hypothetical protein